MATDTKNIIKKNKILSKYIVLLPGSSKKNPLKRWPYFVDLAKLLISKGYEVITILGPEELEMNRSFPGHVLKNLDWSQLSGIIKNSYFVIGNDSGPSHIASCLNKKGLALFGSSTSAIRSELKRGKFEILKVDNLEDLAADEVLEVMIKILNKKLNYSISLKKAYLLLSITPINNQIMAPYLFAKKLVLDAIGKKQVKMMLKTKANESHNFLCKKFLAMKMLKHIPLYKII